MDTHPHDLDQYRFSSPVSIVPGASDDNAPRAFSGVAYSGQPITGHPYWGTVVFDLSTIDSNDTLPMLVGHDREKIAGQSSSVIIDGKISVSGTLSKVTEEGEKVAALADEGFPWQMSVHIEPKTIDEIPIDQPVEVNGELFSGGYVFRGSTLREISFTPTGWDSDTSATIFNHSGGSMPNPNELADLKAENATLAASNETLKGSIDTLSAEIKGMKFSQREDRVKSLCQAIGVTYSKDEMSGYFGMTDDQFSHIETSLIAAAPSREHLFSEQITGDGEGHQPQQSPLIADAKSRAEA